MIDRGATTRRYYGLTLCTTGDDKREGRLAMVARAPAMAWELQRRTEETNNVNKITGNFCSKLHKLWSFTNFCLFCKVINWYRVSNWGFASVVHVAVSSYPGKRLTSARPTIGIRPLRPSTSRDPSPRTTNPWTGSGAKLFYLIPKITCYLKAPSNATRLGSRKQWTMAI